MSYPLSSAVVVGQATEAEQFNNLRKDALTLGNDPDTSGTVRDLLSQTAGELELTRLNSTTIQLAASEEQPVGLMIGSVIYSAASTLSLSVSAESFPNGSRLYIYGVGDSTTGALSLAAGSSAPSGGKLIGTFVWNGSAIIPGTVRNWQEYRMQQAALTPAAAHGRLTLAAGEPVPGDDITMGQTLYFVPYQGNMIGLYLYDGWEYFDFDQLSASASGLRKEVPYDVFLTVSGAGLALELLPWGSSSGRPSGTLTRRDGVRVLGSDAASRYLGTVAVNADGYFEDSQTGRLVWNENNRLPRPLLAVLQSEATEGAGYVNAWVPYFGKEAPAVRLLVPSADVDFELFGVGIAAPLTASDINYGRFSAVGIGQDMNTAEPYTGNSSCVPVFTHSFGNGPYTVQIRNIGNGFQGYHEYKLAYYTNYGTLYPINKTNNGDPGGRPGLAGVIWG